MQQQGVVVEDLLLDFGEGEGLGILEFGVAGTGGADLSFEGLQLVEEVVDFLFDGFDFGVGVAAFAGEELGAAKVGGVELLLHVSFAFQELGIDALADVGVGFGEEFE